MNIIVDFLILGAIAGALFGAFKFVTLMVPNNKQYKYAVGLSFVTALFLFWVNGAVGIIGSENNDANMMYFGVLAVGLVGALIARFKPRGMAYALFATAIAQVLVAVIALTIKLGVEGPIAPWDVVGITVLFSAMWTGAGIMFQEAAKRGLRSEGGD